MDGLSSREENMSGPACLTQPKSNAVFEVEQSEHIIYQLCVLSHSAHTHFAWRGAQQALGMCTQHHLVMPV